MLVSFQWPAPLRHPAQSAPDLEQQKDIDILDDFLFAIEKL